MPKDWNGNKASTFKCLGASTHCAHDRAKYDYYATDPKAGEMLLEIEDIPKDKPIWECAAGEKHLSKVFEERGYKVRSSDIIARVEGIEVFDFLTPPLFGGIEENSFDGTIITNPPYKFAGEFIETALRVVAWGNKVCMFLKVQFLEGKARKKLFEKYPPKHIWVSSSRLVCAMNGDFESMRKGGSAVAYAWYVWEKGYKGDTILKWFN